MESYKALALTFSLLSVCRCVRHLQADQKEGMKAFIEKRKPDWKNQ